MKQARPSFLKKRSKRLSNDGTRVAGTSNKTDKSFLVLFFKKEPLPEAH
jgi:hypothetical protein